MNNRNQISAGELRQQIEESLEDLLKQHRGLRDLKERRRREEIESKLDDAKPLEDILEKLLKQSPTLSNLFLQGLRASTPFKTIEAQAKEQEFKGQRFPTYFKFKSKDYGHELHRDCHINMRCRLAFETDAENEYFSRVVDPGEFGLALVREDGDVAVKDYVLNLQNGIATLSLPLPDTATVGESLHYIARNHDCSRMDPFKNDFHVAVKDAQQATGRGSNRREPPSKEKGQDRDRPSGIKLPNVILVEEKDWEDQSPPFDKFTAMRIRNAGSNEEGGEDSTSNVVYDFYINMDNVYMKSDLKGSKTEPELVRAQFKYGMVLLGLAMLQQDIEDHRQKDGAEEEQESGNGNGVCIEKNVEAFSRAVAPVVIPMINSLGSLSLEEEPFLAASGEST